MRPWIADTVRFGVESHVSIVTLWTRSPSIRAVVHSEANANGSPSSTWKKNGCRGSPRRSGFSHSK